MSVEIVIASSIVVALGYLTAVVIALVFLAVRIGGFREVSTADHDAMSASRLTIPVSLIVPVTASTDEAEVDATVGALLALNYPTFEVIVVADGPAVQDSLKGAWSLEARELFYRAAITTAPVRMMYRSGRDTRLLVVDKTAATLADALNCGVNLARFRYMVAVEPGLTLDGDALLRALTGSLRDPAAVVGATSHVEIGGSTLQRLRSIRSLMQSRIVWQTAQAALGPGDTVVVWRRDSVAQSGGFSSTAADPHLDLMVRLQSSAPAAISGQVVRTAEIFGHRNARPLVDYVRQTARRQMATLQAVSSLMATGSNTRSMLAHFFMAEVLTPGLQGWVIVATAAGAAAGWWPWVNATLAVLLVTFGQAIVNCAALLLRGSLSFAPDAGGVQRLLLLAPLDFVVLGVTAACGRIAGVYAFLNSPHSRPSVRSVAPGPAV